MNIKHEGNQAAGPMEHSESPPEDLQTQLDLANEKITTLEKKIRDMEEFQRPAETEKPNLCQISEGDSESIFLVSIYESIDRRLNHIKRQQQRESELVDSLQIQVRLSKQEREETMQKYKAETQKTQESKGIIVNLSLRLKESQNERLMEKAKHLKNVEALEAKIKSLLEKADEDQDWKKQTIKELQDKHLTEANELKEGMVNLNLTNDNLHSKLNEVSNQLRVQETEANELKEGMVNLNLTNDNLHSKLNEVSNQLRVQEELCERKYEALERTHQMNLSKTILSVRLATQTTQTILDKKFKEALQRNYSLLAQLGRACNERTLLEDSHKQLIDGRTVLVDERRLLIDERRLLIDERTLLIDERTLLEDICLELKKKCRGVFGRRMQEREVELDKMKKKMRETQTETMFAGTTHDADGPMSSRPLLPQEETEAS